MYVPRSHRGSPSRGACARGLTVSAALALLVVVTASCAAFQVPEPPAMPTPMDPVWSEEELRDHVKFLNDENLMGRATGTRGYAQAAAYVAARMRGFRLQPVVDQEYRVIYNTSINYPTSSVVRTIGAVDSRTFLPGIDYLPDARSDSGRVRMSRLIVAEGAPSSTSIPSAAFGIVVPRGGSVDLPAWRDAGARVAVLVSDPNPRFQPAPISNLVVIQMTPRAAALALDVPAAGLSNYLLDRLGQAILLSRELYAAVTTDYQPQAGAINVLGYVSGQHPVQRRRMVIVCADLDAVGHISGVRSLDFQNFGISTAAVLGVARNLGFVARRWLVPDRSVMVAIWSGSQIGHQGLRYFLEHPTWEIDRIVSLIYVGLDPGEEPHVRRLLNEYGIPLTVIPAPTEPLFERDVVLQPDPALLRLARDRYGSSPDIVDPDLSTILDSAAVRARGLAASAYDEVLLQATDTETFFPVREDTLPVPGEAGSR